MNDTLSPEMIALGDGRIDSDHEILVRLVAQIDDLLAGNGDTAMIASKLVALYRLAEDHFSYEDTLMAELPPGTHQDHLALHKARHAEFIRLVMAIAARAKAFEPVDVLRRMYGGVLSSLVGEMLGLDAELVSILARPSADGPARPAVRKGTGPA